MKRNKGFTLVELLAVIAILAIIIVAAVPAVNSLATNSKKNMFCKKVQTVERSAQLYGEDSMKALSVDSSTAMIDPSNIDCVQYDLDEPVEDNRTSTIPYCEITTIQTLIDKGYVTLEKDDNNVARQFIDPKDGRSMLNDQVMIYIVNKRVYSQMVYNSIGDAQDCTNYVDYQNLKQRVLYYRCKDKVNKKKQLVGQGLSRSEIRAEDQNCR